MISISKNSSTGIITLVSSHNIIIGHKPDKLSVDCVNNKICSNPTVESEKFGLFDASTPNYATFYPNVKPEDFNPKEEDFINPVFRLLSQTVVWKGWRPIDFSKKGVLKKSMQLLIGQSIHIDHETALGNTIGSIPEVKWQDSYRTKNGVIVPAGINGVLKIDAKSNPRIARGILMEPPSIHSNSVTVRFKYEPSHTFDTLGEFWDRLGTYDKDGQLIRLIVTEILGYSETSLVGHGADPYAQIIKSDGSINNPEYAARQYDFSSDSFSSDDDFLWVDYKYIEPPKIQVDNNKNSIPEIILNNQSDNNKVKNMKEELKHLFETLGLQFTEDKEEKELIAEIQNSITELKDSKESLTTKVSELENAIQEKDTKITELSENIDKYKDVLEMTRDEAAKLYKLSKGEKADDSIINLIKSADIKSATSLLKQYREEAEAKYPPTCKKCGSHDIDRMSGKASPDGIIDTENTKDGKEKQPKETAEVFNNLRSRKKQSRLFNTKK